MLPFLKELTEARLFYSEKDLNNLSAHEIAEIVYIMIMTMEILRHSHKHLNYIKDYATKTLSYYPFDKMHYAATDLGNLISVLVNQDLFAQHIKVEHDISLPVFQTKRYLNSVAGDKDEHHDDSSYFYRLESFLKLLSSSNIRVIRRNVSEWTTLTASNRVSTINFIRREFDKHSANVDLYLYLKTMYRIED